MEATVIENLNLPAIPEQKKLAILAEFEFEKYEAIASEWAKKANSLVITDASQLQEMKLADDGRKVLQKIRTGIDKKRKELKEQSLQEGRAIDAIAKALTSLVEPIELVLKEKAEYAENLEKARIQAIHEERYAEIVPFLEEIPVGFNYGSLDNGTYQGMLKYAKEEHQARLDLAEAQRIAQEESQKKKDLYNERRVALAPYLRYFFADLDEDTTEEEFQIWIAEGKRLDKEASDLAEAQKAEIDRLQLQRTREKALFNVDFNSGEMDLASMTQDEFKSLYETHQKIYLDKVAAEKQQEEDLKKLASAPDKQKLQKLADDLSAIVIPEPETTEAAKYSEGARELIGKVVAYVKNGINKLP